MCIQTVRSSPVRTCSMMTKARKSAHKRQIISGQPSKLFARNYVFQVHRHILRKHRRCLYIKCRVKGCNLTWLMSLSIELKTSMHIISFIILIHTISVISVRKLSTLLAPGDTINIANALDCTNVVM